MTGIRARIDRIEAAVRQARERGRERITEVFVHCPVEAGDPRIGEEPLLVYAGVGCSPSIYEVYEEEAGGA